jgi:hypothetical protein
MGEDLLDDIGVLNARDDSHRPAAGRAGLDVDTEHPLQGRQPRDEVQGLENDVRRAVTVRRLQQRESGDLTDPVIEGLVTGRQRL